MKCSCGRPASVITPPGMFKPGTPLCGRCAGNHLNPRAVVGAFYSAEGWVKSVITASRIPLRVRLDKLSRTEQIAGFVDG